MQPRELLTSFAAAMRVRPPHPDPRRLPPAWQVQAFRNASVAGPVVADRQPRKRPISQETCMTRRNTNMRSLWQRHLSRHSIDGTL